MIAGVRLLDGATGTELERRGADVSLPLWATRALIDAPELVEAVHRDMLEAGADIVTANTFRTQRRTLEKAGVDGEAAKTLTRTAVELAKSAVAAVNPEAVVAGSVPPLEDCYHPELCPEYDVCRQEMREHIGNLLEAGVDLLLLETMGTRREVIAAAHSAQEAAPGRWMVSLLVRPTHTPGVLLNGSPLADVIPDLEGAVAIGVNCLPADMVAPQLELLRGLVPEGTDLIASANIGIQEEDGSWTTTAASDPEFYADRAMGWIDAGATIVGGCCGTTHETIAAIRRRLAGRRT